jgi:choline dehydrogenase-like flavoprotein
MDRTSYTDLALSPYPIIELETDICIIGAGAAGIYLTTQLSNSGHSVVLLEAGPFKAVDFNEIGFHTDFTADNYPGATSGRFFGLGGSTSQWGGVLIPHTLHDKRDKDSNSQTWDYIINVVSGKTNKVLNVFGYNRDPDFESYADKKLGITTRQLNVAGFHVQSNLHLPFTNKNFINLLTGKCSRIKIPKVFFNAVSKYWVPEENKSVNSRFKKVVSVSRNGNKLSVSADKFIIAAGAIESARILLEINDSAKNRLIPKTSAVGCYLGDHLSMPIADVTKESLVTVKRLFSPSFQGNWMRNYRLLTTPKNPDDQKCFAHFIFDINSIGFELIKDLMKSIQQRRLQRFNITRLFLGFIDLSNIGYSRFVRSRLYIPDNSPIHLQLDMEQKLNRENRISLTDKLDEYGRRITSINWKVSDDDIAGFSRSADYFLSSWPGQKGGLPNLNRRPIGINSNKPYDAYHPVGVCRMGEDNESVVDSNLKVRGTNNLWLVSTGVLPSAGTANPTFTILCLAQNLSEQLELGK